MILEVTSTSELIVGQLGESFFYNLLCPKVICGDFAKSLAKVIATRETQKQAEKITIYTFCKYFNGTE